MRKESDITDAKRILQCIKHDDSNTVSQALDNFYNGHELNDKDIRDAIEVLIPLEALLRRTNPHYLILWREVRRVLGQFKMIQEIRSRKC